MANTDNNTIQISISQSSPAIEIMAGGAITPGKLTIRGTTNLVYDFNGSETACQNIFAVENVYEGGTISDAYAIGDRVMLRHCRPGDIVLAWLAPGQTVNLSNTLTSDVDGNLQLLSAPAPGSIVGVALEAVTTTGSAARIMVEIGG